MVFGHFPFLGLGFSTLGKCSGEKNGWTHPYEKKFTLFNFLFSTPSILYEILCGTPLALGLLPFRRCAMAFQPVFSSSMVMKLMCPTMYHLFFV